MEPIGQFDNIPARKKREVLLRKYPDSKISQMRQVLDACDWSVIFKEKSAHIKAEYLQDYLLRQVNIYFPEKRVTFSDDDKEYFTPELKQLDRKRKRIYSKQGRSSKWKLCDRNFKQKLSKA